MAKKNNDIFVNMFFVNKEWKDSMDMKNSLVIKKIYKLI